MQEIYGKRFSLVWITWLKKRSKNSIFPSSVLVKLFRNIELIYLKHILIFLRAYNLAWIGYPPSERDFAGSKFELKNNSNGCPARLTFK